MDRITESFLKEFIELNSIETFDSSTQFEFFANHCVVSKEYGKSNFNLDNISTGKGTQGIDGIAIIVNNKLVETIDEITDLIDSSNTLDVKFIFIQSKTGTTFDNADILNFFHWTKIFFSSDGSIFQTEEMKKIIELKDVIFDNCKYMNKNNPVLSMYYVTLGKLVEDKNLSNVIESNKQSLVDSNLFSKVEFNLIGANQIQQLYRATKEKSCATFKFSKNVPLPTIPDIDSGYYGIIPFSEFKKIIITDNNTMKNVFEDNIRDFLGIDNDVNSSINNTLSSQNTIQNFTLLNNGITIVAEELTVTGEIFTMKNYQIVNGCQTSHILFQNKDINNIDTVYIPIKIIATTVDKLKSKITTATNNQTAVKREQLESLSEFQRNLEAYYNTFPEDGFKLYYERLTNQYNQSSIPKNRIVSIPVQIKVFSSMFLNNPHGVSGFYGTVVKRSQGKIFKLDDCLLMYYVSALAYFKIESFFKNNTLDKKYRRYKNHMLMLLRIKIAGKDLPHFNSKRMDEYCNNILTVLNNNENLIEVLKQLIEILNNNSDKFDLSDRKLFERKETTDLLLSFI